MSPRRPTAPEEKSIFQDEKAAGVAKLLVSILHRAIRDYSQYKDSEEDKQKFEHALDAWEWFQEEDETEFGSFASICMLFNIDPDIMRKKVGRATRGVIPDSFGFLDDSIREDRDPSEEEDPEGKAKD